MNRLIMKSLSVILLLASGVSCQKQEAMDDGGGTRGFVIRASLEEGAADTRTSMSPNEDETSYAVFWNETDCISVNGIASESISIQEDRRSAEFTFLKGFESALYAAYPASVVSKYESGALTLLLPNVQTWSESDQFDPAAAVMLAQAADGASLRFRHAMAYLRVTLSEASDPEPIAAVVLSANDGSALCGAFLATYGSDLWTLTPQESAASQVELRCGTQGAPLGSRMVIAIPAGEYAAGLTVQVKDVSGDYQVRKSVNAFTAQSDLVATYFDSDQMKMYETITDFAQQVLDGTCIDDVIATGTCIQNLRTSSLNDDPVQDLSRDGFHLDYGVSRYAAACTIFYTLFEPCLRLDLSGNTYRYDVKLEHSTAHSIPVTDENVEICRHAAHAAADHPLTLTDMSLY